MHRSLSVALLAHGLVSQNVSIFEPGEIPRLPPAGISAQASCTGDFDGDGDQDLAILQVSTTGDAEVEILANDGRGVFGLRSRIGLPPGLTARIVRRGDVDGDGDLDLWVGCGSLVGACRDQLLVNDGTGALTPTPVGIPHSSPTDDGLLLDIDGDGDLDLLRTGYFGLILERNDGGAQFTNVTGSLPAAIGRRRLVALDFDNDGDIDLFASTAAEIWLNDGSGLFTSRPIPAPASNSAFAFDADGDGDDELLLMDASGATGVVLYDDVNGYRAQWIQASLGPIPLQGASAFQADADPAQEIVTIYSQVIDLVQGQLVEVGLAVGLRDLGLFFSGSHHTATVADFDSNGLDDVFRGAPYTGEPHLLWLQRSQGQFVRHPHWTGNGYGRVSVLDLDRDGCDDLVGMSTGPIGPAPFLYSRGREDGGFDDASAALADVVPSRLTDLQPADLDGDGQTELLCFVRPQVAGNPYLAVVDPSAGGTLTFRRLGGTYGARNWVVDVNSDGRDDLVFHDWTSLRVLLNLPRRWLDATATALPSPPWTIYPTLFVDFDGDGDLDMLAQGRIYDNVGGSFVLGRSLPSGYPLNVADFDGDGDNDVHLLDVNSRHVIAENTGGNWLVGSGQALQTGKVHAIDFDLDGRIDLVGKGAALRNTTLGLVPAGATFPNVPAEDTELGDFDGDGDPDLVRASPNGLLLHHNLTRQLHQVLPADRGQPIAFEVTDLAAPNAAALLMIGAPGPALSVLSWGTLHLDPATIEPHLLPTTTRGARWATTVPNVATLTGMTFRAQALFLENRPRLSNFREFTVW